MNVLAWRLDQGVPLVQHIAHQAMRTSSKLEISRFRGLTFKLASSLKLP